jgi:Xaa-Pro dipeptidase
VLMNASRASALLAREKLDGLLATGFENVGYVVGFIPPASWWLRRQDLFGRFALAVQGSGGIAQRAAITPVTQAAHYLTRDLEGVQVVPYGYFPLYAVDTLEDLDRRLMAVVRQTTVRGAIDALAGTVQTLGLRRGRIGVDTSGLSPEEYQEVARALEGATLVSATALFREIRAVKTAEEQRRLRHAAQILHRATVESARAAREGMTEIELAREFTRRVVEADASATFIAIGFGERSAYPGVIPSDRRLRRGDVIRYDCGCVSDLYHSDHARTYAYGEARDTVRRKYRAMLAGERRAIGLAAPGVPVRDVFAAAVDGVRAAGVSPYERAHVGHAIGLEVYEHPMFRPESDAVLEPGMVLTIETPYYEIGAEGVMTEDIVLITAIGAEAFTEPDPDLIVL